MHTLIASNSPKEVSSDLDLSGEKTNKTTKMELFERLESEARFYCRKYPEMFEYAYGSEMVSVTGRAYIDLISGCGSLNFGHNNPVIVKALSKHLADGRPMLALDLHTTEKYEFLAKFERVVLNNLLASYKVQCVGPTGTNAIEAALKLARKVTGRRGVIAFTNSFHGMSLGALAATGNKDQRKGAGVALPDVVRWPFDGYGAFHGLLSLELLDTMLRDPSGGVEPPAAILVETVQGEGGINVASKEWLLSLQTLAHEHGALLIVDEIQTGCGRTGPFLSFERTGLMPDIVTLAKSIGGGLPLALILMKTEHDIWHPGEHNGTFRGPSMSFTAANAALDLWVSKAFRSHAQRLAEKLAQGLEEIATRHGALVLKQRGLGLMRGLVLRKPAHASLVQHQAFERGVLIELCGPNSEVLKFMPALNMPLQLLGECFDRLDATLSSTSRA